MTRLLLDAFEQLDRGWVWLYTAGMHPEEAARRRAELESDQWELSAYGSSHGWSTMQLVGQKLGRWLLGVPADITWRLEFGPKGFAREGLAEMACALLVIGGLTLSLPLAFLLAVQGGDFSGHGANQLLLAYIFPVVAVLGVGGLILQEFRPAAGTLIAMLGILSISLVLWWTVSVPALGALCAAGILLRARRLKR